MSSSNSPIERLQYLTLDHQMSSTAEQVRARSLKVRDILSSFDRDEFPSEYRADIFDNLDRPLSSRPKPNEWTRQADLPGTLLQWAAYDEHAYNFIKRIQKPESLARCFHEKLARRLGEVFHNYDDLAESGSNAQEALAQVMDLAVDFRTIVIAIQEDRRHREIGQTETARLSLGALVGVCQRHRSIVISSPTSQRSSKRIATSSPPTNISFLSVTAHIQPQEDSGLFLMLEVLSNCDVDMLSIMQSDLETLSTLLHEHDAPQAYKARADVLVRRATDVRPKQSPDKLTSTRESSSVSSSAAARPTALNPPATAVTATAAGAAAAAEGVEEEEESSSKAGTKRQAAQQGGPKRGRKKATRGGG